jgi:tRNA-specific 2-thiouridylase
LTSRLVVVRVTATRRVRRARVTSTFVACAGPTLVAVKVLVAMSGGVDSSVAAARLVEAGHLVVGATLKLWGGPSDSGCCSVADVDDARQVAARLGIDHHVFNFAELFERAVVGPYVASHRDGRTPNPCIECNRRVKFGALLDRSVRLGFDALATGHHARVVRRAGGRHRLARGADAAKDQSYVLSMLGQDQLAMLAMPVGELTKAEVRAEAARLGLATAAKPDSQDVCFIESGAGRGRFLAQRVELHAGEVVDEHGSVVGAVPAVELVTVGQRRGLGVALDGRRRFAVSVDVAARRVVVGDRTAAARRRIELEQVTWVDEPLGPGAAALAQTSAHGPASAGCWDGWAMCFDGPVPLVAPGQTVALYDAADPSLVLGSGVAAS